ncbi:MAG: histidinol-phosphate transaminase [Candidatus Eisenbacteria bacterium]|nr:histidinol-phosphate transaminase [Candidatus Eisenbacteria bacterium]
MKDLIKENVSRVAPYVPGRPIELVEQELGIKHVLKFASNENPLGPSPLAIKALSENAKQLNRYPDSSSYFLRKRLSKHIGFPMEQIIVGNGSNELIELICHLFAGAGDEVVVGDPSFPMYKIAIDLMGATPVLVPLKDYRFDMAAMAKAVTPKTTVVFVCNPNNPTGTIVTEAEVREFMDGIPEKVVVVFDEAYCEYVKNPDYPDTFKLLREGRLVISLRTFSKIYALAGLRVGYGVASEEMVFLLNTVRLPFNVTSAAQVAAEASLDDEEQVTRSIRVNSEGMAFFKEKLTELGLTMIDSEANFFLVDLGVDCKAASRELEKRGLIVRPVGPFGLPDTFVRISVGIREENERLLEGLKEVLAGTKRKKKGESAREARLQMP